MANYQVVDADRLDENLTSVADAIREKSGTTDELEFPDEFAAAILAIDGDAPSAKIGYITSNTLRVGENLLQDNMVILGEGWTGNLSDGFTHTSGNTAPLTFAINAVDGESYFIEGDWPNTGATQVMLSIGDSFLTDPYNGTDKIAWGVTCVNGGSLIITPKSEFSGYIRNLTCKKVVGDGIEEIIVPIESVDIKNPESRICGMWNINIGSMEQKMVNGTRNISVGHRSLCELVTGGRNIGVGTFTLQKMKTGENNVSIGADAGYLVERGENNVAIGITAMSKGKSLKDNVAIGFNALVGADSSEANGNVVIGTNAGYRYTGKSSVMIGSYAGYSASDVMQTLVGQNAGRTATGWGSTAIGAQSETGVYSQSIAIGYQAQATKSKQAVLGGDAITETVLKGDIVVRGTDGVKRKLTFNADGTCSWVSV